MIFIGLIMMVGTLGVFNLYIDNLVYAQTMAFSVLMMFQMFNVLNVRSDENSLFKIGVFSNPYLIGAIVISIALQLLVIYTPLSNVFNTEALRLVDLGYVVLVSASVLIFGEVVKLIKRRMKKE